MDVTDSSPWAEALRGGGVIPACPLALTRERTLDERRQRGLLRYYRAAGALGLAVGVHTTQFAIREPHIGLLEPVWRLAVEELDRTPDPGFVKIAGICGRTAQACREAELASDLGFHLGLLGLGAWREDAENTILDHCQRIGEIIPLFGFYLQPAVGGRILSYDFWRRFAEIPSVRAIKIAPFNRYQTFDVVRAVIDSGRADIALYTGNDDAIVQDLVTPFRFRNPEGRWVERRIVGGLLGQWAVWTERAVALWKRCREAAQSGAGIEPALLQMGAQLTDVNAAVFDAANGFAGCIAGIHEVLRRQGLLEGTWCLDPEELLSPGQALELDRVMAAYPALADDAFVLKHRHDWLRE